jgi:hypothetical protein
MKTSHTPPNEFRKLPLPPHSRLLHSKASKPSETRSPNNQPLTPTTYRSPKRGAEKRPAKPQKPTPITPIQKMISYTQPITPPP